MTKEQLKLLNKAANVLSGYYTSVINNNLYEVYKQYKADKSLYRLERYANCFVLAAKIYEIFNQIKINIDEVEEWEVTR